MNFELSAEQLRAINAHGTPLVIIAPAGSGKTAVLAHRIAARIADGQTRATQCVAVSFTQAAAWELSTRVAALTESRDVRCGTFHSHALSLLKLREEMMPSQRVPRVLPDPAHLLAELAPRVSQALRDRVVREYGWLQAVGGTPKNYLSLCNSYERTPITSLELFVDLITRYEAHKWRNNIADFGDLLVRATEALAQDGAFAKRASLEAAHFYVDEFQDINPAQLRLLSTWGGTVHPDLTVVGDPRQAIYTWNGSDPRILENLAAIYPEVNVVELTTNFRSTSHIVALGDEILGGSSSTKSVRTSSHIPVITGYESGEGEVKGVIRSIRELHYKGVPYANMAVLARAVAALKPFSEALTRAEIPHSLPGRSSLGSHALTRALMAKLAAERASISGACDLLESRLSVTDPADPQSNILSHLLALASEVRRQDPTADLDLLNELITTGRSHQLDMVTLTTFHRAKGLQWYAVYATGLAAKSFPHPRTTSAAQIEEERRLLYVAATRATDMLSLTWGGEEPTRFLATVKWSAPQAARHGTDDPLHAHLKGRLTRRRQLIQWRELEARRRHIPPNVILGEKDIDMLVDAQDLDLAKVIALNDEGLRSSFLELLGTLA